MQMHDHCTYGNVRMLSVKYSQVHLSVVKIGLGFTIANHVTLVCEKVWGDEFQGGAHLILAYQPKTKAFLGGNTLVQFFNLANCDNKVYPCNFMKIWEDPFLCEQWR